MAQSRDEINQKQREKYWAHRDKRLTTRAKWSDANRDKLRAQHAADHAKHRDERLQKLRDYYIETREEQLEKMKAHRLEHLEEKRAYFKDYYAKNRDKMRAKMAVYAAEHPEIFAAAQVRYRANKQNAPVNDFTAAQWRLMQEICDHRCAYCGKRAKGHLHREHLTPLSNGGSNTWSNILPACRSCNSRKGTGSVLKAVQPLLL